MACMRMLSRRTSAIVVAVAGLVGGGLVAASDATGPRAPGGPPPGSPRNHRDVVISTELIPVAASVATEDTVLFGYGIDAVATKEERASVLGAALRHLLG
jgi:hypothetical protein